MKGSTPAVFLHVSIDRANSRLITSQILWIDKFNTLRCHGEH